MRALRWASLQVVVLHSLFMKRSSRGDAHVEREKHRVVADTPESYGMKFVTSDLQPSPVVNKHVLCAFPPKCT